MIPRIKELWVAALRSGNYKQGKKLLRNSLNEYCCLGVLCDLYVKEHPEVKWESTNPHGDQRDYYYVNGKASILPDSVVEWAGIGTHGQYGKNLILGSGDHQDSLVSDNDNHGKTFLEIADIIEAKF